MPQVAARINEQQERWLKDYFRTKSAGAEFILPWAVDTFFRAITTIKGTFTGPELKTILEAHRDQRLLPAHTLLSSPARCRSVRANRLPFPLRREPHQP